MERRKIMRMIGEEMVMKEGEKGMKGEIEEEEEIEEW